MKLKIFGELSRQVDKDKRRCINCSFFKLGHQLCYAARLQDEEDDAWNNAVRCRDFSKI